MSVEIACTSDELPPHSHVYEFDLPPGEWMQRRDTGEVRIWVDWKAVAHALAVTLPAESTGRNQT